MKGLGIALLLLFVSNISLAVGGMPITLQSVDIHLKDKASIERGAKFFAQHCMVCHTMKYLVHDKLAQQAGITKEKMPLGDKEWWFGSPPPDLSLIAQVHSPAWLYTFLHSFYQDKNTQTGYNNLLAPNTAMPNPFISMQGTQELIIAKKALLHGKAKGSPYYSVLKLTKQGSMSSMQFDQTITDLVNFLVYASTPERVQRETIGWGVLAFLLLFAVLTYCLKKAYWKPVKK